MPHHLVGRGHLEVEHAAHGLAQEAHVAILDVAAIFAQVHGDAVGAGELDERRRPHRIGIRGAARLAQRGDVIDVDVELHAHGYTHRPQLVVGKQVPAA